MPQWLIKEQDAPKYECCVMPKRCDGATCMAWVRETRMPPGVQAYQSKLPLKPVETGLGSCGMVRGQNNAGG